MVGWQATLELGNGTTAPSFELPAKGGLFVFGKLMAHMCRTFPTHARPQAETIRMLAARLRD